MDANSKKYNRRSFIALGISSASVFCMGCGNDLKSKDKDDFDEEELKDQIASDMTDYRGWVDDIISEINEGGLPQSEVTNNLKEAKSKSNNLIDFFKKNINKLSNKNDRKLVEDRIKDLEGELKAIDDMIKKSSQADNSFACPYCKKEISVKDGVQEKEMEIECELCHKKFKCITGIIRVIRGKTNARVQYGAEPISITLKLKNKEVTVNFKTNFRFLVNRNDKISVIYLKKFLSKSYNENPSLIYNWSSEEVYKVGLSLF